jgi:SAM-dependent methyltransferase
MSLPQVLSDCIPLDHARQVHVTDELIAYLGKASAGLRLLDLGCGDGRALEVVRRFGNSVDYLGIDIEDSSEVKARAIDDPAFLTFDGVNLPFPDDHFDVIYSCSVLEHARNPEPLLREVARTLKPDGMFLGSVSFLEPYHSHSIFNFTPYGVVTVFSDNGLCVQSLRPGIDGFTLMTRYLGGARLTRRFFHSPSPVNRLIDIVAKLRRKPVSWVNAIKLRVCGHIVFVARKALS